MRREIETLEQFDEAAAKRDLSRAVISDLDLTQRDDILRLCRVDGALFLGCRLTMRGAPELRARGALLFPHLPDVPLNVYRVELYDADELYDTLPGGRYEDSLDARAYAWSRVTGPSESLDHTLASALHDNAVTDALDDYLDTIDPHTVVGVMGGHAVDRGSDDYSQTARLAMDLAADGLIVASGGGPGAMEAANLGASLSPDGPDALAQAVADLARVPSFRPSIDDWARAALDVRSRHPNRADSLGIPTWFYGHEPPNVFATHIAKYCSNALREDILLSRCRGGLIYLPGAAGTVQELFQAATGSYYAADPSDLTPLVLVGVEQWTKHLPAWPLLQSLAKGKPMEEKIALVDTVEEAGALLRPAARPR